MLYICILSIAAEMLFLNCGCLIMSVNKKLLHGSNLKYANQIKVMHLSQCVGCFLNIHI